jgi:hypothetical protein
MRALVFSGMLAVLVAAASPLHAACGTERSLDRGAPLRSAPGPAGFAAVPEACAATEVALQGDAAALIAAEDFFGTLEAAAAVRARYAPSTVLWFSLWLPGLSYRFAANATVEAESVDLGAGALGVHFGLPLGGRAQLAPFARVLLPTETIFVHATRYGVEHGLSFVYEPSRRLELVGGVSFPLLLTDSFGTLHSAFLPTASAQAGFTALSWLHLVGGASLRIRGGDESGFEAFEPALGVRFFAWRRLRLELGARAPLWGDDRTDLGLALNVGYLLPGAAERP